MRKLRILELSIIAFGSHGEMKVECKNGNILFNRGGNGGGKNIDEVCDSIAYSCAELWLKKVIEDNKNLDKKEKV